nr:hypothetical protein [Tanacetum cinerariifolium]
EAFIHKNHEGSKHEGRRIRPTIRDFGGNCAINQYPFNNKRNEEWEEEKNEDQVPTTKIFRSIILINNLVCRISEKFIADEIDECHILLERPWRCEVNGKYDFKQNLYLFSWEEMRIARVQPKVTPQLPKPEVKVEEKILKAEVVDEHIEKIQDLQSYIEPDDKISTLLFGTTNKVIRAGGRRTLKLNLKSSNKAEDMYMALTLSSRQELQRTMESVAFKEGCVAMQSQLQD